ncbi:hypothetical protein [Stieleria marina]|uniref:HEAT repeat protein n=1 Tax=Stieleria marina TaxID=1930275 RepID=A0A517NP75_9BACT|nr:hypothetical protein K239x_08750 [Planctomycetes bacterium K23_9]
MEGDLQSDPQLVAAALVNGVVNDLLYQSQFELPHYPEWVDLAVIATGLGTLRSGIAFVKKTGLHWDSTQWGAAPRPFLNIPSLAYANAMAAWVRSDSAPSWASDLNSEIKRPMRVALKYLNKTKDSFFQISTASQAITSIDQTDWWKRSRNAMPSTQVIALGRLIGDADLPSDQESSLVQSLRSNNRAIVLHSIAAAERMRVDSDVVADELRSLVNDRDDEVRAKSLCAVTSLGKLDDSTIQSTDEMLDSHFKHNVFAAIYALSTLDSIPEFIMPSVQRAFMRALKSCDYEFVGLFAAAYNHWFDDPRSRVETFLQDSPELMPIAIDAIEGAPKETVAIG